LTKWYTHLITWLQIYMIKHVFTSEKKKIVRWRHPRSGLQVRWRTPDWSNGAGKRGNEEGAMWAILHRLPQSLPHFIYDIWHENQCLHPCSKNSDIIGTPTPPPLETFLYSFPSYMLIGGKTAPQSRHFIFDMVASFL
jgi:hypothetical protein